MPYTLPELMKALNIEVIDDRIANVFDEVVTDHAANGVHSLREDYIKELQNKYDVFPNKYDYIQQAAKTIRENEALSLYTALLVRVLRDNGLKSIIYFEDHPKTADGNCNGLYGMTAFFAHAEFIPHAVEYFSKRNVPKKVIRDTLLNLEDAIIMHKQGFKEDGFEVKRHFGWNQHFIICDILMIERLNFEMRQDFHGNICVFKNSDGEYKILMAGVDVHHSGYLLGSAGCEDEDGSFRAELTETDEYYEGYPVDTWNAKVAKDKIKLSKSEWSLVLKNGDSVISVHIPDLPNFTPTAIDTSYAKCREIIKASFPEFEPRAFVCGSWMMDPQLRNMLKPTSNIVYFQSKFMRFPYVSNGTAVFTFLFKNQLIKKIEDQPENTSLERAAKKHYLDGKFIYEQGGCFFEL